MGQRKECNTCGDMVELEGFNRQCNTFDGRAYICRDCYHEKLKEVKKNKQYFEGLNLITGWKPTKSINKQITNYNQYFIDK